MLLRLMKIVVDMKVFKFKLNIIQIVIRVKTKRIEER